MSKEFQQIAWDEALEDDCRQLIRLAIREDLGRQFDLTTLSLVEHTVPGRAFAVARQAGVACGLKVAELVLDEMDSSVAITAHVSDGDAIDADALLATFAGPAREILTAERLILNFLGRLSGIASLTRQYVQLVDGTQAGIYDTRKTTPGWRRLEKMAVRSGGGRNHRTGLYDAVLIKDNHLALVAGSGNQRLSPADAVVHSRTRLREMLPGKWEDVMIEVEVDSLEQLQQVLPQAPDIVLLDNMTVDQLREAVAMRNAAQAATQLEASGGVNLETVVAIAESGVERISVGALTHSAVSLDVGLDWQ